MPLHGRKRLNGGPHVALSASLSPKRPSGAACAQKPIRPAAEGHLRTPRTRVKEVRLKAVQPGSVMLGWRSL